MSENSLNELHTALVDAQAGYEKAIEDADDETVRRLFERARDTHAEAHADIHAALAARQGEVEGEGSFMGTVHKTVIAVRAAVTGLDEKALGAFADGEERILEAYDKAIADEPDGDVAEMLGRNREEVASLIASFKSSERV
jgi:uncharacterized protein (TIGR02284 family)